MESVSLDVLKRMMTLQLLSVIGDYMTWITPQAHSVKEPVVKTFVYSHEQRLTRWDVAYVFTLKYHGRDIVFKFSTNGHNDCSEVEIDFADITGYREIITICAELTYEIYMQLRQHVDTNNIRLNSLYL